jgi:hypothetical protein
MDELDDKGLAKRNLPWHSAARGAASSFSSSSSSALVPVSRGNNAQKVKVQCLVSYFLIEIRASSSRIFCIIINI